MTDLVSIVIPIYNQELTINDCIESLKVQTFGFERIEIMLINDGSEDASDIICQNLAKVYSNIKYYYVDHKGVSAARNIGITNAKGKYIFYLDADDQLSKNTILDCVLLFDDIYNQVDLVTYPIETYYRGKKLAKHYRYLFLKENGVYDLSKEAFIGQTTMNIVVKNKFEYNITCIF